VATPEGGRRIMTTPTFQRRIAELLPQLGQCGAIAAE
jgi:hypothetical protein